MRNWTVPRQTATRSVSLMSMRNHGDKWFHNWCSHLKIIKGSCVGMVMYVLYLQHSMYLMQLSELHFKQVGTANQNIDFEFWLFLNYACCPCCSKLLQKHCTTHCYYHNWIWFKVLSNSQGRQTVFKVHGSLMSAKSVHRQAVNTGNSKLKNLCSFFHT